MVKIETVLIVHQNGKILLGMKNPEKFGGGKWNGFGGSTEEGETLEETAIREAKEEGGIKPISPIKVGNIIFKFATDEPDHDVHFYKVERYEGQLVESNEMVEYRWFEEDKLPIDQMWPADRYWLPHFIAERIFKGIVHFGEDFSVAHYDIKEANSLD